MDLTPLLGEIMEEKEKEKEKEKEQKECGLVLEYQDASHLLSSISVCFPPSFLSFFRLLTQAVVQKNQIHSF